MLYCLVFQLASTRLLFTYILLHEFLFHRKNLIIFFSPKLFPPPRVNNGDTQVSEMARKITGAQNTILNVWLP